MGNNGTKPATIEVRLVVPVVWANDIARSKPDSAAREQYVAMLGALAFDGILAALMQGQHEA